MGREVERLSAYLKMHACQRSAALVDFRTPFMRSLRCAFARCLATATGTHDPDIPLYANAVALQSAQHSTERVKRDSARVARVRARHAPLR